jgi:nicotinamidase-related amidase
LLVLNVQTRFTDASAWYPIPGPAAEQLIDAVNDVSKKAKDSGIFIVYAQQAFGRSFSDVIGRRRSECRIDPRVRPVSQYSFATPLPDAFSNPRLDTFLRNRRINHIFLMGIDGVTSVARTATSALERGYNVTFIGDGIVTVSEKKWARKLKKFSAHDVFAVTCEEFRDMLNGIRFGGNGKAALNQTAAESNSTEREPVAHSLEVAAGPS